MKIPNMSDEGYQRVLDAQERAIITRRENQLKKVNKYFENPKRCLYCNSPIKYEYRIKGKFCSRSCSGSYNTLLGININMLNKNTSLKKDKTSCLNCGDKNVYYRNKFCSVSCNVEFNKKIKIKEIESDLIIGQSVLRNYLMNKYDCKCQKCGWGIPNPISNTVCLDMHHIDGDYKNNRSSNVELLCPNCHSLTNTYKRVGKDRKSTREYRKT